MKKIIETERLLLRTFKRIDAEFMFKNWASDRRVTKYLRWQPHENVELTASLCEIWEKNAKSRDDYLWVIIDKKLNEPIGSIGVVDFDKEKKSCELGFCIGHDWWGKGIVNEALEPVIKYLSSCGFERLYAVHNVENKNSGKVLIKAGFEKEGVLRKYDYDNNGNLVDMVMYSLIIEQ